MGLVEKLLGEGLVNGDKQSVDRDMPIELRSYRGRGWLRNYWERGWSRSYRGWGWLRSYRGRGWLRSYRDGAG